MFLFWCCVLVLVLSVLIYPSGVYQYGEFENPITPFFQVFIEAVYVLSENLFLVFSQFLVTSQMLHLLGFL